MEVAAAHPVAWAIASNEAFHARSDAPEALRAAAEAKDRIGFLVAWSETVQLRAAVDQIAALAA